MPMRFVAIALIAGMLSACSNGAAEPSPSRSTVPSVRRTTPTPMPSAPRTGPLTTGPNVRPGEKPPVYPDLAKHHTAEGALAFGIYYFKAYDWGYATNDPSLVRSISDPLCTGCASYIDGLRGLKRRGEVLRGGRIDFVSSSVARNNFNEPGEYVVDVGVDEQAITIRDGSAIRTVANHVSDNHSLLFVSWSRSRWTVSEVSSR